MFLLGKEDIWTPFHGVSQSPNMWPPWAWDQDHLPQEETWPDHSHTQTFHFWKPSSVLIHFRHLMEHWVTVSLCEQRQWESWDIFRSNRSFASKCFSTTVPAEARHSFQGCYHDFNHLANSCCKLYMAVSYRILISSMVRIYDPPTK